MKNIKYHLINSAGMIIFSLVVALSVSSVIRYLLTPAHSPEEQRRTGTASLPSETRSLDYYFNPIVESGFFKIPHPDTDDIYEEEPAAPSGTIGNLTLAGTVTGPREIALAMIRKRGEREPGIFSLIQRESGISNDVYGYTLVKIAEKHVELKHGSEISILRLYEPDDEPPKKPRSPARSGRAESGNVINRTISQAEIQQKVLNNMDNALRGLTAGPHRVNNEIVGYRLIRLQPYNVLYQYGARTGDIIMRVNGHALNSTERLYRMWEMVQSESQIRVDIERGGRPVTFNFTITD